LDIVPVFWIGGIEVPKLEVKLSREFEDTSVFKDGCRIAHATAFCHDDLAGVLLQMFCQDTEGLRVGCGWEGIVAVIVGFKSDCALCMSSRSFCMPAILLDASAR
jgi:hypothetical protein